MDANRKKSFGKLKKIAIGGIILCFLFSFILLKLSSDLSANEGVALAYSSGAVVIEQTTRRVLYEEGKDIKLYPASTTKILTALVVLNNIDSSETVKIPKEAVGIEGSSIYLREGEELTVKELLLGLMLRSGNDAATALALKVSGSIEEFAKLMNETAKECGAVNSNFVNPHGLHDDNHYTTAYDLALISAKAMENEEFKEIAATKNAVLPGVEEKRYIQNKNKILWCYEGGNGIKTGFTKKSGRCLVASALRDGMQVISVVLNHPSMWEDSERYMDYAFSNYEMKPLVEYAYDYATVVKGKEDKVKIGIKNSPLYPVREDGKDNFRVVTEPFNMKAPVKEGQLAGRVYVYQGNRLLFEGNLYTLNAVDKKSIFDFFKR
ncbi:MAG: D-alanyl-D-alanine carboxypeptidase [Clostridiales bacterium]|nr:D-alanyl-D-alanine carboxypeptidase [Clostridiales bacterium]